MENTQNIESQEVRQQKFVNMLKETTPCRGLELVESSSSANGIQVRKERHDFPKYEILIVRSQWTKSCGGWSIRVNNFYNTKRHFLQIPIDTLKQCQTIIQELKDNGSVQLWSGHFINANDAQTVCENSIVKS